MDRKTITCFMPEGSATIRRTRPGQLPWELTRPVRKAEVWAGFLPKWLGATRSCQQQQLCCHTVAGLSRMAPSPLPRRSSSSQPTAAVRAELA